jgi:hypothetical protein
MNLLNAKVIELQSAAMRFCLSILWAYGSKSFRDKGRLNPSQGWQMTETNGRKMRRYIKNAGAFAGKGSPKLEPELFAMCNIVKKHIRVTCVDFLDDADPLTDEECELIRKVLSRSVSKVKVVSSPTTHDPAPWYLWPEQTPIRTAAENLVSYLKLYAEDSRLVKHNPLAICPTCDGLFLIQRSGQKTCSDKCRFEVWRETNEHGRDYWKPEKRYAKKRKKR